MRSPDAPGCGDAALIGCPLELPLLKANGKCVQSQNREGKNKSSSHEKSVVRLLISDLRPRPPAPHLPLSIGCASWGKCGSFARVKCCVSEGCCNNASILLPGLGLLTTVRYPLPPLHPPSLLLLFAVLQLSSSDGAAGRHCGTADACLCSGVTALFGDPGWRKRGTNLCWGGAR